MVKTMFTISLDEEQMRALVLEQAVVIPAAQLDAGRYVEHLGGDMPCDGAVPVDVILRDGSEYFGFPASNWSWEWGLFNFHRNVDIRWWRRTPQPRHFGPASERRVRQ